MTNRLLQTLLWFRNLAAIFGIDLLQFGRAVRNVPKFIYQAICYANKTDSGRHFNITVRNIKPCLTDADKKAGNFGGHYFHQDLWAARRIYDSNPDYHVDVGSRIDGFISHLLVFMPVTVIDIRSGIGSTDSLQFIQADATKLACLKEGSVESLSSLHTLEHFGLGRYGDQVEPNAWRQFANALTVVLKEDGTLYVSVPVGRERLEFNAHRVFDPYTIIKAFEPLNLTEFSVVDDSDNYVESAEPSEYRKSQYACGLFCFSKPADQT